MIHVHAVLAKNLKSVVDNNIALQVGVKILLKNKEGKFLLLHRSPLKYSDVDGRWDIVGGRIEAGKNLLENLKREVKEETNLEIYGNPQLIAAQDILRNTNRHVVRLTYFGNAIGEVVLNKEENDTYKWCEREELNNIDDMDKYFKELVGGGLLDNKHVSENIEKNSYDRIANFIYETSIHSKTPRSGMWFLGSGKQSVAEHLFHTAMIGYVLCHLEPRANKQKVILMSLFHDIGEGRTSDLNYVHQRYGRLAEASAVRDIAESVPFGEEIDELFKEAQAKETLEARLVKDADQLEFISTLRAEEMKGNAKAREWLEPVVKRLKTEAGKKLGESLMKIHPDAWWFDVSNSWFVDRKQDDNGWNK